MNNPKRWVSLPALDAANVANIQSTRISELFLCQTPLHTLVSDGVSELSEHLRGRTHPAKIKCQINFISYAGGSPQLLAKYDSASLNVTFN
jgi:hypothetical protein